MPSIKFNKEDFLRSKIMKPGWYHCLLKAINTKAAKTDGSTNYVPMLTVVEKGEYVGVPLQDNISEKALGIGGIRFIRAFNNGQDPSEGVNYEMNNGVGKVCKVHVSNTLYNGRVQNSIDDYDVADPNFKLEEE